MFEKMQELSPVEQAAVKWQYGLYGDFYTDLFRAISRADTSNLAKLAKGFPVEVEAYWRYGNERGWWTSVQDKMGL